MRAVSLPKTLSPSSHIDFVPFTTGSKRGLDPRVSLKQALAAQGFKVVPVAIRSGASGYSPKRKINEKLAGQNENLRVENKDYKLLRKEFGSKQIDNLLEQAKAVQKSKQRGKGFKNNKEER